MKSDCLSILVVDDNQPMANTMADILDARGFEVFTAYSGAEALEVLRDHPVDILLTDVRMPDMNGVELYRETRKIYRTLTTIMMTAYSTDSLIQQAMAEGIKTILDKPVDIDILFELFSAY